LEQFPHVFAGVAFSVNLRVFSSFGSERLTGALLDRITHGLLLFLKRLGFLHPLSTRDLECGRAHAGRLGCRRWERVGGMLLR
jgi:hypothetical protein